jgi:hypothetical protein
MIRFYLALNNILVCVLETLSLKLCEQHTLIRLVENRAAWGIFGPEGVEVAIGWGRLHIVDPHNFTHQQEFLGP